MDTVAFLTKILPFKGLYVVAEFWHGAASGPRHTVHDTIESAAQRILYVDSKGITVYHACATYVERRPKGMRKTDNVLATRAQWIDIDVGEKKDYASAQEALAALIEACKALHLPMPLLVSSGRGIHAYWVFDTDVPVDEAQRIGAMTTNALAAVGFRHDTSRTADVASILRPVGSHWRKGDPPRAVRLLRDASPVPVEKFVAALAGYVPVENTIDFGSEWSSGVEREYPPSSAAQIINHCGAVRAAVEHPEAVPEPLWRAMLGLVKHTTEGAAQAHEWSKGHPDYDEARTQEKIERWTTGPTTCDAFSKLCDACTSCPYHGTIKSPIALGYADEAPSVEPPDEAPEAEEVVTVEAVIEDVKSFANRYPSNIPFWPRNYRWDGEFLSRAVRTDPDQPPEWINFSNKLFYPYMRYQQEDSTWAMMVCALVNVQTNKWRHFELPAKVVAESQALANALGAFEIYSVGKGGKEMQRLFFQDVMRPMMTHGVETAVYNGFGWHDSGFVIGGTKITSKGRVPVLPGSRIPDRMKGDFGSKGTPAEWSQLINTIYNRPGAEPYQFVICAAFAAPLVSLVASDMWHGIPIALTGKGGLGKTTTCKVACSVYGDPSQFTMSANESGSTSNALLQRVAVMRNLPILMDEITGREASDLQNMLFALSNGKPKERLRPDGTAITADMSWDTISFVTGNTNIINLLSQLDSTTAEAVQLRCFEIDLPASYTTRVFKDINAKEQIEHQLLSKQYGTVGEDYLRYVLTHKEKVARSIQKLRAKRMSAGEGDASERYLIDLVATVSVAGLIAKELGMINFNIEGMRRWAMEHIKTLRNARSSTLLGPLDYFHAFVTSLVGRAVVTMRYSDGRSNVEFIDEKGLRDPVARVATADRVFLVTTKYFNEWCRDQKIDARWLRNELDTHGHIVHRPGAGEKERIFRGTTVPGGQVRCIEFNYDSIDNGDVALPKLASVTPLQEKNHAVRSR